MLSGARWYLLRNISSRHDLKVQIFSIFPDVSEKNVSSTLKRSQKMEYVLKGYIRTEWK